MWIPTSIHIRFLFARTTAFLFIFVSNNLVGCLFILSLVPLLIRQFHKSILTIPSLSFILWHLLFNGWELWYVLCYSVILLLPQKPQNPILSWFSLLPTKDSYHLLIFARILGESLGLIWEKPKWMCLL